MANSDKSLESWIWDAACSIRGAKETDSKKNSVNPVHPVKKTTSSRLLKYIYDYPYTYFVLVTIHELHAL
ncbi:MAG TPA: hypothetical protein DCG89_04155 [Spartobacteria bacterium]|jgi:hypothetical protein|nr:hypothetical protein [Spartobacteria bacterium]